MGSGLFYTTGEELMLGDNVLMYRWPRRPLPCVVCYIPGLSPQHRELEYDDVRQWALRGHDGAVYPILYDPAHFQPQKRIRFVARGTRAPLQPEEVLE